MENMAVNFVPMELATVGNVGQGVATNDSGVLGSGNFMAAFIEAMQGETDGSGVLTANGEKTQKNDAKAKLLEEFKPKNSETDADDALLTTLASTLMEIFPMAFDSIEKQSDTSKIEIATEKIAEVLTQNKIPTQQFIEDLTEMGMSKEMAEHVQKTVVAFENETVKTDTVEKQKLFQEFCVKLQENVSAIEQKEQSPHALFNVMRGTTPKIEKLDNEKESLKTSQKKVEVMVKEDAFNVVSHGEVPLQKTTQPVVVEGIEKKDIKNEIVLNVEKAINDQKKEIIMKLSPESLGEITVKIVKEGGKLSVNLISTMQETAKLLENAQAELKSALKPMGENVVVTTTHANAENNLAQFLNGQRQWQGQQQSRQNNLHYFSGYQQVGTADNEANSPILTDRSSRLSTMYA